MFDALKKAFIPAIVTSIVIGGLAITVGNAITPTSRPATPDVIVPETLSAAAMRGQDTFRQNCAACHGAVGQGTIEEGKGPPLIHDYYNPGHHPDEAFYRAAKMGVPSHHWPFGNMPAQPQVSNKEIADIVAYIRELQRANGIHFRPHRM